MKKISALLLIIIFSFAMLAGCGSKTSHIGWVTQSGDWIYYVDNDENSLYKIKADMTEKTKLTSALGGYKEIAGEYIYFYDNGGNIWKMKTDGTGSLKVADTNNENLFVFHVSQNYIYYALKPGSVYRIKTDGTQKSKIAEISSFNGDMKVSGDWIYYKVENSLYKMKIDGTKVTKLIDNVGLNEVNGDWVYYGEQTQKGEFINVYRMKSDGTEKSKLADGAFTAIDGEYLYYSKDGWLYRSNLDGTSAEKMNNVKMWSIYCIYGNYIFYGEYSGAAYRINLDGSNKTRIE